MSLTASQRKIFDFIESFIRKNGYAPTFRNIQEAFGFSSLGSVYSYVQALKKAGFLQTKARGALALTSSTTSTTLSVELPWIGAFSPHGPLELYASPKLMNISSSLVSIPERTYILSIKEQGMVDEALLPNDWLLIETADAPTPGSLLLIQTASRLCLLTRKPFLGPNEQLHGIVIGLIRSYSSSTK